MLAHNASHRLKINLAEMNNNNSQGETMIEQKAKVISTKQGYAWVVPQYDTDCGSCASKTGCSSASSLFSFLKPASEKLYVVNPLHAKPGDEVVIGMQGNALLIYSVFAYLLPLLSMLAFAILGNQLFLLAGLQNELGTVLAGVAGLISGFKLAGWLSSQVAKSEEARPVILRHKEQIIYPLGTISHG